MEAEKRTGLTSETWMIEQTEADERLDRWMAIHTDYSRSQSQRLCDDGKVLVNGKAAGKNYRLHQNDCVSILPDPPKETAILSQDIPLDIVYEDTDLLVVNKPKGMVVHPAPGNADGTLVNALLYHCGDSLSGIGGVIRPGIVHRLDKDTSGLLIVAKNDMSHQGLAEQIKEHSFTRRYQTVVYGRMSEEQGEIDLPIGRHPVMRKKMAVVQNGRTAKTAFTVIARYEGFTHLELELFTGRTHQIRVHLASQGHPVAGDALYGPRKTIQALAGQCLHAKFIGFTHPRSGERIELDSELPSYFVKFLSGLRPS